MKERSADNDLKLEPNCFTGNSSFSRVLLGTKISKNTFAVYTEGSGETELFLIKGSHELPVENPHHGLCGFRSATQPGCSRGH